MKDRNVRRAVTAAALLTAGVFSGCATIDQQRAVEQDVGALQSQVEVLRQRVEGGAVAGPSHSGGTTLADLSASLDQMRQDLARTNSELETMRHDMAEQKRATEKMLQDSDQRVQELEKRVTELNSAAKTREAAPPTPPAAVEPSAAPVKKSAPTKDSKPKDTDSEEDDYQHAIAPMRSGEKPNAEALKDSETRLKAFLKSYPKSRFKPNAHYWMGEVYYRQSDYKRAIVEFEKVAESDPKHEKVAGARLKQGLSFIALKKNQTAKLFLEQVVEQFPQSQEAQIAKRKLAELR